MKHLILSILIVFCFAGKIYAQQQNDVRGALLGNNPNTTLTTGIGQVVQPVGIPVVKPPGAVFSTTPAQPTTKTPTTKKNVKPGETKYKVIYDYYELGEVHQKQTKDQKKLKKEAAQKLLLSNELVGGTNTQQTPYYSSSEAKTVPEQKQKVKPQRMRIPYSELPPVKKIPYNF